MYTTKITSCHFSCELNMCVLPVAFGKILGIPILGTVDQIEITVSFITIVIIRRIKDKKL